MNNSSPRIQWPVIMAKGTSATHCQRRMLSPLQGIKGKQDETIKKTTVIKIQIHLLVSKRDLAEKRPFSSTVILSVFIISKPNILLDVRTPR